MAALAFEGRELHGHVGFLSKTHLDHQRHHCLLGWHSHSPERGHRTLFLQKALHSGSCVSRRKRRQSVARSCLCSDSGTARVTRATFALWRETASRTCFLGPRRAEAGAHRCSPEALGRRRELISRMQPHPSLRLADRFVCLFVILLVLALALTCRAWLLDSFL